MTEELIKQLAEKFVNGTASLEEQEILNKWYDQVCAEIPEGDFIVPANVQDTEDVRLRILDKIHIQRAQDMQQSKVRSLYWKPKRKYVAIAASVAILITVSGFLFSRYSADKPVMITGKTSQINKSPMGYQAVLTLGDNSTVQLDSSGTGQSITQGNGTIRQRHGMIAYNTPHGSGEVIYNVLTTPRGSKYMVTLSEGSRVWLNAASSIRFPVSFQGNERRVWITGEAYFEIAPDEQRPFYVAMDNENVIQVLGTSFNVMNYKDEKACRTTLLSGSIKMINRNNQVVLKPNEQGIITENSDEIKVGLVRDVSEVIAWKQGVLHFTNSNVSSLLRHLSRCYDIDVILPQEGENRSFSGDINVNMNLSVVIEMLDYAGLHLEIENKKLKIKSTK